MSRRRPKLRHGLAAVGMALLCPACAELGLDPAAIEQILAATTDVGLDERTVVAGLTQRNCSS